MKLGVMHMPNMIPNRTTRGLTMLVDLIIIVLSYGLAFLIFNDQMTPKTTMRSDQLFLGFCL